MGQINCETRSLITSTLFILESLLMFRRTEAFQTPFASTRWRWRQALHSSLYKESSSVGIPFYWASRSSKELPGEGPFLMRHWGVRKAFYARPLSRGLGIQECWPRFSPWVGSFDPLGLYAEKETSQCSE